MKWLCRIFFTFALIVSSNRLAFSDSARLVGEVEHNQLDTSIKANTVKCPLQPDYAKAISQLLAGYDLSNVLKSSAQKNTIQASAAVNASNIKTARTVQDVLANHDLAIIVDRSGSMTTKDCPGGLSRWQWCRNQASQLAQAAAQASSSITEMFFNSDLQIFNDVNPKNLPILFNSYAPGGGTVLGAPLVAELDRYFASRSKPLIIVVITDGLPEDHMDLAPIIRDASDSLHYVGEVTISFLLVGNQVNAEQFKRLIGQLDGGGIKNGGMVDVIAFKELATKGIKQTLFDELKTITLSTNKYKPSTAAQFATGRSLSTSPLNQFPTYSSAAGFSATNPFPFYSSSALTNPFPVKSLAAVKAKTKSK